MPHEPSNPDDSTNDRTARKLGMPSRRRLLATLGAGIVLPFGTSVASAQTVDDHPPWARGQNQAPAPAEFRVKGTQTVRVEITPDEIVRHEQKRSSALRRRYGITPPVLEKTERIEREDPAEDAYPERDTITETTPWDTYYAKEDEWSAHITGDDDAGSASSSDVTIMYHDPVEGAQPYGIWEYNQIGNGYEIVAPMNVISEESLGEILWVISATGGWGTLIAQWDRWAWNSDVYGFRKQDAGAASDPLGLGGRGHIRFWEFGGYVSGSAHIDSSGEHEAVSYDEAEQEVEEIFDQHQDWEGIDDYYDLDNGGLLDHDGEATDLWKWND